MVALHNRECCAGWIMDQINEMDRKDVFEGWLNDPEWPEVRRKYLESLRTPLWHWSMEGEEPTD